MVFPPAPPAKKEKKFQCVKGVCASRVEKLWGKNQLGKVEAESGSVRGNEKIKEEKKIRGRKRIINAFWRDTRKVLRLRLEAQRQAEGMLSELARGIKKIATTSSSSFASPEIPQLPKHLKQSSGKSHTTTFKTRQAKLQSQFDANPVPSEGSFCISAKISNTIRLEGSFEVLRSLRDSLDLHQDCQQEEAK